MRSLGSLLVLTLIVMFTGIAIAEEFGEDGEIYVAPFEFTATIDGKLDDWQQAGIPFQEVPHDRGTLPAKNDDDASFTFALAADDKWLYFVVETLDEKVQSINPDSWKNDSFELYFDGDDAALGAYDANDVQLRIGVDNLGKDDPNSVTTTGTAGHDQLGTMALIIETGKGWILEGGILLENPKLGKIVADKDTVIGFNIQYNDDDDGNNTRDGKLIWAKKDTNDGSWNDPSKFGDLVFIPVDMLAIEPQGKMPIAWGRMKAIE
jgi:endo-1,4-beta-xylanase